jgi:arabinose-5-phosphate isomerase
MKVASVMAPAASLPWLRPTDSIWDVLDAVTSGRRGFGIVSEKDKGAHVMAAEVGVISDGDIRKAARDRAAFGSKTAAEIMTRNPTAIAEDAMMVEALRLMEENRFSFLLCRDQAGRLTGAVHMHDIVARDLDVDVRRDRLPGGR